MNINDLGSSEMIVAKLNQISNEISSFIEKLIQREPTFTDFLNVWKEDIVFNVSEFLQNDLSSQSKNKEKEITLMEEAIHSIERITKEINTKRIEEIDEPFKFHIQKDYWEENEYMLVCSEQYEKYDFPNEEEDLIQSLCDKTRFFIKSALDEMYFYNYEYGIDTDSLLIKDFKFFIVDSSKEEFPLKSTSLRKEHLISSNELKSFIEETNEFLDNQFKDLQMFWTDLFDMFILLKNAKAEYTKNIKRVIAN